MNELEKYIKEHQKIKKKSCSFKEYLYYLMDKYGFEDNPDFYNKANISKQHWHTILEGKHQPKLSTVLKLVFTLKCDNDECKYLMKKAGYTLPSSSKFSLIIRYCLENKIYDLAQVNDLLTENGYDKQLIL